MMASANRCCLQARHALLSIGPRNSVSGTLQRLCRHQWQKRAAVRWLIGSTSSNQPITRSFATGQFHVICRRRRRRTDPLQHLTTRVGSVNSLHLQGHPVGDMKAGIQSSCSAPPMLHQAPRSAMRRLRSLKSLRCFPREVSSVECSQSRMNTHVNR